eukprot:1161440-Pelagomonas_calceolata.AAC.6
MSCAHINMQRPLNAPDVHARVSPLSTINRPYCHLMCSPDVRTACVCCACCEKLTEKKPRPGSTLVPPCQEAANEPPGPGACAAPITSCVLGATRCVLPVTTISSPPDRSSGSHGSPPLPPPPPPSAPAFFCTNQLDVKHVRILLHTQNVHFGGGGSNTRCSLHPRKSEIRTFAHACIL